MIRTYLLPNQVGLEFIHDAIYDYEGAYRRLIQDTTEEEHKELVKFAVRWREANEKEINVFNSKPKPIIYRNYEKEIDNLKDRIDKLEKERV